MRPFQRELPLDLGLLLGHLLLERLHLFLVLQLGLRLGLGLGLGSLLLAQLAQLFARDNTICLRLQSVRTELLLRLLAAPAALRA